MTHAEKVLALLSDGKPHSHHELYALHVMGHSRIADLRKKGHEIRCWREGENYLYQLGLSEREPQSPGATPASALADLDDSPSSGASRSESPNGSLREPATPEGTVGTVSSGAGSRSECAPVYAGSEPRPLQLFSGEAA